ncbi:MAG: UDP-4-amino-4,6-dideoxy-N-acetyl-beta-L-altrosamine transaminase [Saprospiraceae bacterium]|nr:UDP-4-amino-4,6-dideoxy-N-acetyl-beta-L-altrosamine transaminase [Saprospiraceae bacterium]MBK7524940.1 UDP-4-amino-4,6-dideoxy-N-acetyl-beta-L-altrosamine transaminase [Saprospiraceae bacterium]MBK8081254.1 UDP-4-amino-4,6-dideoxy-N-acetyl-beta-L-altrosamine transaminase [Saprospiraceae bacterium]MBK8370129.1 UDP-4-amino-4,6-dideoxy-N-acetyl-beta-L-altrosamine transaminase [Saprospiraceae bacterium]MBK8546859.1 UDP-4-amino-4,6-dideoxy-N-acetyl-beta-L-altrosamine transaminase [Saprospiraceae
MIPYGKQNITSEDIKAVTETLLSSHLTQGPKIAEFEEAFAKYIGSQYAVAVANGTAALHLCAMAMQVEKSHKVITTPITFAASANCVRYCGGEVEFVDIDPNTYLLDVKKVEALLKSSPKGTFKGIIPVDFAGRAVNLEYVRKLADEYNLWIIEDACHAPGGYFIDKNGVNQNCGNGMFAELAIFSFHPVKHIACGEGGMITTNDEELYKQLLRLRSHGITKGEDKYSNSTDFANGIEGSVTYPGWYMEMQQLGYNYRLTDIQAALGISQLKRAHSGLERRKEIARRYEEVFKNKDFIKGQSGFVDGHAYHLYVIEVEDRLGLYNYLKTKNIFPQIHYIPTHLMPYYRQYGWKEGDFPHSENYYKHCISLPLYPTLLDEEQDFVIETILRYYHA